MRRSLAFLALAAGLSFSAGATRAVAAEHEPAAQHAGGDAHGHDHVPSLDDFNWYYGIFGEQDDVEPSLFWRPKGMPVPFAALAFNSLALYYILYRFGKKPLVEGLKARKAGILKGMAEAGAMKADAEARLADYENKLKHIDQEVERVREEMRRQAELERKRILSEAKEKRARMERDARQLVDQEFAAARESLFKEAVRSAVQSAERALLERTTPSDQQRLADDYLQQVRQLATARGKA